MMYTIAKYIFRTLFLVLLTLACIPLGNAAENKDTFETFETFDDSQSENDGFETFDETQELSSDDAGCSGQSCGSCPANATNTTYTNVYWWLGIVAFTILAGFFVRHPLTRKARPFFLLLSVIILGFYRGGCPCMISSIQNTFLAALGTSVSWQSVLLFLGLIPLTYIFGKVWCGWVCHLGALQEFLFIPGTTKLFRSVRAQKTMKYIRWFLLITLLIQLVITKTNIYRHYGPFKVAYNLFSANLLGYILLGLLLISSLFIYRPFCKAICPIGLILGWITKIPGAAVLGIQNDCTSCTVCNKTCRMDAINREGKTSILKNQDCIACGDCMDSCHTKSLSFYRKGKKHDDQIELHSR